MVSARKIHSSAAGAMLLAAVALAVVGLRCLIFVQPPAATHARPSERPPAIGRDSAWRGGAGGLRRTPMSSGSRAWAVASFLGAFLLGCSVAIQPVAALNFFDDFSELWTQQFASLQAALFKAEQRAAGKKEERQILMEAESILKAMETKEKNIAEKKTVSMEAVLPVEAQDLATLKREEQAAKILEAVVEDLEAKANSEEKRILEAVEEAAKAEEMIIKEEEAKREALEKKQEEKPLPPPAKKKAEEVAGEPAPPPPETKGEEEATEKPVPPPVVTKVERIQTPEEAAVILKEEKKVEAILEEKLAQALKEEREAKAEAEAIKDKFLEETENAAKTAGTK